MNSPDRTARLQGKTLTILRFAWFVCALAAAIVLLGALPSYYPHYVQAIRSDPYGLGRFNLSFQVLVGLSDLASGFISFALAILLFWRKPNERMALFVSFFLLITAAVSTRSFDYFLSAYFAAPSTYKPWSALQTPLWFWIFAIFPDGRYVPRWTRWLFLFSIPLAWPNPPGEWAAIFNGLPIVLGILLTYAQVYRYLRVSSDVERKQTKWVLFSLVVSIVLSFIASLIYRRPSPPLLNVIPFALTIAILRSHLWDIDILIRKTLQYTAITALLSIIYFGSVFLLQRLFSNVTGQQSPIVLVVSTLLIAALFAPLRRRIQDGIDRRFYRKKYDARQVVAQFARTARDETDMNALLAELERTIQETLQPEGVRVWLRKE